MSCKNSLPVWALCKRLWVPWQTKSSQCGVCRQGGRCGLVTQLARAKATCWIKEIYCSAWKQENHGLGSWGTEGGRRRLHSFCLYVRLTRQTLAGVPHCCLMSQTELEAVQTDSSLLDQRQSLRALLRWEPRGSQTPHCTWCIPHITLPHLICRRIKIAL